MNTKKQFVAILVVDELTDKSSIEGGKTEEIPTVN